MRHAVIGSAGPIGEARQAIADLKRCRALTPHSADRAVIDDAIAEYEASIADMQRECEEADPCHTHAGRQEDWPMSETRKAIPEHPASWREIAAEHQALCHSDGSVHEDGCDKAPVKPAPRIVAECSSCKYIPGSFQDSAAYVDHFKATGSMWLPMNHETAMRHRKAGHDVREVKVTR